MTQKCPNCGYSDSNQDREQGYEIGDKDGDSAWGDGSEWEQELATPSVQSWRCPDCGETV